MNAAISIGSMPANDRGVINDEQPRIRRMLNTFDPKILPSANWSLFFLIATKEVASSGSDVPPASMVTAMNLSLTPVARANSVADLTNRLPPYI